MDETECECRACEEDRFHKQVERLMLPPRRHADGSLMIYVPMLGPSFPPIPILIEAEKVGECKHPELWPNPPVL